MKLLSLSLQELKGSFLTVLRSQDGAESILSHTSHVAVFPPPDHRHE